MAFRSGIVRFAAVGLVVFGLTGGIGCGKSLVADHWRRRGLPVVDADVLAREAVSPGEAALRAIVEAFGPSILAADGQLNRPALGARVFGDPAERARLNAIVHPRVRELARQRFAALEAAGEPLACYEVPLLVETGQADAYRPMVVVSCNRATQKQRLASRDGTTPEQALERIESQMPVAKKAALADFVIDNDAGAKAALARADEVLDAICETARVDPARYPRIGEPTRPPG